MVKYCRYCGAENRDTARVCEKCGRQLESEVAAEPREKKHIFAYLGEAFSILEKNPITFVLYVILAILIFMVRITVNSIETTREGVIVIISSGSHWTDIPLNFIAVFPAAVAIIVAHKFHREKAKISFRTALKTLREKMIRLIVAWLFYLVIISIVGILGVVLILIGSYLGAVIYFIIYAIVVIFFALIYQGIIIDDLGVIDTFKTSYEISRENFWAMLGIMFIIGILGFILMGVIAGMISIFVGDFNLILNSLRYFIICPIIIAFTLLYLDRKWILTITI